MKPWRRRARRLRRLLVYGCAALVILAGLLVALASQLLPLVQRHPQQVAAWLSERSGQPVAFRLGAAEWTRRGPLFAIDGLSVGSGAQALDIGRAELLLDVYAGLLPGRPLTELRLRGIDVQLVRDAQGRWQLAGLGAGAGAVRMRQLEALGEVQLEDGRLAVLDEQSGRRFQLDRIDARVRSVDGQVRIGARAVRGDGAALELAAELDAGLANGRAWLGGRDLDLAEWLRDQSLGGLTLHAGTGDLGLWATLSAQRIVSVQAEAALQSVALRGNQPIEHGEVTVEPRLGLDRLAISALWRSTAEGWRVSVPRLLLDDGGGEAASEALLLSRNDGWQLQAGRLELGTPLALAMLGDALPAGLRRWLYLAAPHGMLQDLRLACAAQCRGHGALSALRWRAAGAVPGVEGLGARVDLEGDALLATLDGAPLRIDAPAVFAGPITASAAGRLWATRAGAGWHVGSDAIALQGADFAATATGTAWLQGDGSRPLLDLSLAFADAPVSAARQFWVPRRMPPKVIDWLDRALLGGTVERGRLLLRGDLDDWPFRDGEGVFDAEAELRALVLDYRPGEWPRGEALDGWVRFVDGGMQAVASGRVEGLEVREARASIPAFSDPVLQLDIEGAGSGAAALALLRASPLEQRFGSQLLGLSLGGTAAVRLDLQLPLRRDLGEPRVRGIADLIDADLADAKWGLAFEGATGRVRFGDDGFAAEELRLRFDGAPATLSIAIGAYASAPDIAAEASLRGQFDADALLAQAPALDWLSPWVEGRSDWSLLLSVPREPGGSQRSLRVRSDLVGTTLSLPAPLRKGPAAALPLDLEVQLPLEQGGIELALGGLLSLRARLPAQGALAAAAAFGGGALPPLPAQGLAISGSVPALDVGAWAGLLLGTGSGRIGAGAGGGGLQALDLVAGELDLLGRRFADVRVQVATQAEGTRIELEGAALAGSIEVPDADLAGRGITARFARLHWPEADPAAAPASLPAGLLDPAAIPPLHLWIGALQLGEARLGETRLETFPTPQGMHVQLAESRSDDLELRASGDWGQVDGRERSRFQMTFTAEDLGRMLAALGFAGVVQGGQTLARLDATWPGAPTAFDLGRVDGRLELSVGQGTVPDVEPGAGRILGLLSLSQLPRRLALDFSDFLATGFSFNTIRGSFVLDGGSAYTEDLVIDSAAAEIRVRGRTGLAQQTYDQTIEVLPRTSGVLPVVGALAAGPAGAAIGAVAQAVLQRPMKEMTRVVYQVGGSWDAPQIEVVERGPPATPRR